MKVGEITGGSERRESSRSGCRQDTFMGSGIQGDNKVHD
jgi:hypothetical protein